ASASRAERMAAAVATAVAGAGGRRDFRFALLVGPAVAFVAIALLIPLLAIVVFSFWRTESYELYADWNLDNYRTLLSEPAYRVFLMRSLAGAFVVSLICLSYSWPVAYFIARF